MAKISVIVPAHNVEKYLDRCLESITAQTYRDLEIICVNDHSEDATADMLKKWATKDGRITVLNSEKRGLSAARNCGLDQANGEFIMFCDSDDSFVSTMCEDMLVAIEESGASMAICEMNFIYDAYRERQLYDEDYCNLRFSGFKIVTEDLIPQISVYAFNKIYRKSVIDEYDMRFPEGRYYEDAYFTYSYLTAGGSIYFLQKRLYNYVRRQGSIMATTWSKKDTKDVAIDHLHVIIAWYDFLQKFNLFDNFAMAFWTQFLAYLNLAVDISKSKAAKVKIYRLAEDFIKQHWDDFEKADVDARGGIINAIPKMRRKSLHTVKRLLLKVMPVYTIQIENTNRMKKLIKRNTELTKALKEISSKKSTKQL